jgi:peptidoglycan/LPS O-acetylase OafA/YrhL
MRTKPLLGRKAWFGPRRLGWGLGPAAPEGWALVLVFVLIAVGLPLLFPHHWWIIYPVLAALLIVIFLKGTSPGGSREWAEYQASKDGRNGDPGPDR